MINIKQVEIIVNDIRLYLLDKNKDLKSNQQHLRMRELFCRYIMKVWFGTNFNNTKFEDYNKIIITYYI